MKPVIIIAIVVSVSITIGILYGVVNNSFDVFWTNVLVSAGFSGLFSAFVGFGIAFYVKHRMKTEYEKNYEENRESEARWLFIVLERYHKDAMRIFNNFESEFNELGKMRKELVAKMKFVPLDQLENEQVVSFKDIIKDQKKMDYLKDTMNYELEQMKKVILDYEKDRNLNNLRNYFSFNRFILKIFSMMKNINDYAEGLFQADLRPNSLMWAIKNADEIIQYLKEKDLHKKDVNVKVFVERWEKAVNDYLK